MSKKKLIIVSVVALITGFVLMCTLNPIEPEQCSICTGLKRHAPCLLNLSTGEIRELELYEPHPYKVGELTDHQDNSTFSYIRFADIYGTKITNPWEISIKIPLKGDSIQRKYYCLDCRKMLSKNKQGYVMLDLYTPSNPTILPIHDGAEYSIRCYLISINMDKETQQYEANIVGTLNTELP